MTVLGYLPKLKRDLKLAFGAHFVHCYFIQMLLIWFSINWQSFNVISFFTSQNIKQNVLLISIYTIDDVISLKIYLQSSSKAMTKEERDEGKSEIQKFENLENENDLLVDEVKIIFHN